MRLNFSVVLGSVRRERLGLRVARYVVRSLEQRGHAVTLIDPVEHSLPLLDRMYKEYPKGQAPELLEKLATIFRGSDANIVVSGEYNHSVPPALSNLLDHFLEEYYFRPSAIVCYSVGGFGGVRAAMQLRAMLAEMGMPSIPSLLPFPKPQELLDAEGLPQSPSVDQRAARFYSELEWYAQALRTAREQGTPY